MNCLDLEHNFFGRKNALDLLKRRVTDLKEGYRQNLAVLGYQYVGKTAILQKFYLDLDDRDVVPVYLCLENKDFSSFFHKFVGGLLYNYSKNKQLPLHHDLNLLIECCKKTIPNTIEVIQKIRQDFDAGKAQDSFQGLINLPEVFANETGKFCVLIFDEFQNLEEFMMPNIFQELGKKIMTQKRCLYLVASSYPAQANLILSEKFSLLFGNFETIFIEPFDMAMAQGFIEQNLKGIKIGAQLKGFLADFSGGHPLYLGLICQELIYLSSVHKQEEIYMPILAQAVENTLFERWGVLSRHFELLVNEVCAGKGNKLFAKILTSIAQGHHKIDDLSESLDLKKGQLLPKVNHLIELGIIDKNGTFHYLKDKLFRYWLKYVLAKRMKDVDFAHDKQRKQFKEEFNRSIDTYKVTSRQDFATRIVDLLHCFDNESIDLNGRKYRLPLFREINAVRSKEEHGNRVDVIRATTGEATWVIVSKKDNVWEQDINNMLSEFKKNDEKPERCLIVTLAELEDQVKLRALQERFWVWNEGELNTLLTLFDKPYITR